MEKKFYDHKKIEAKWRERWEQERLYEINPAASKDTYYCLDMFPYPSGLGLHVGHWRGYVLSDYYARYQRLHGKNVLHPMGLDSFGLPAERAAIKDKSHPKKYTDEAADRFIPELKMIGSSFDWSKYLSTSDPNYYHWTQWLFIQLFNNGLAEKRLSLVNWCPNDQTVLANEQVINGCCERCGATVTKKELAQWYLKTTDFAQELLEGLNEVNWPERVKTLQREWIGKSSGTLVHFELSQKSRHFVLLHGYKSGADKNFLPWLKAELEKRGHTVEIPDLQYSDSPNLEEQVNYVLQNCKIDEDTIILGHSLGSAIALKVAQQKKIKKMVLVAGFLTPRFKDHPRPFEDKLDWQFDSEKIKNNVGQIIILSDKHDTIVGVEHGQKLQKVFDGELIETTAQSVHFNNAEEPEILSQFIDQITVFTTRVDTIFGVNAVVLAPEHQLVADLTTAEQRVSVNAYLIEAKTKTNIDREQNKEKTAVFSGSYATHPLTNEKVPVWIADYVLMEYGTGAVMSVPAHDERDYQFALKYDLPIKTVIEPITGKQQEKEEFRRSIVALVVNPKTNKLISINWGEKMGGNIFIGGGIKEGEDIIDAARREIAEETGYINIKFVNQTEKIHHHYFAYSKNVARSIEATGLLFELINEEKSDQKLENDEKGKFQVEWLSKNDVEVKIKDELHKTVFERLVSGKIYSDHGQLVNSGRFSGLESSRAIIEITNELTTLGLGRAETIYRLRDWLVSRQRYWGAPIPIVYDPQGNPHPVKEEHLPLLLPDDIDFLPGGESPITRSKEYAKRAEVLYGKGWHFETDTLDTFVDSSWYYLRYLTPNDQKEPFNKELVKEWLPVDLYIGGIEHATLHLLYARFVTRFLAKYGYIDEKITEPFKQLFNIGMITLHGAKMSKSKGNVVTPEEIVEHYGTDALRGYELFIGPMDVEAEWSTYGINGIHRFLLKVFHFYVNFTENEERSSKIEQAFSQYLTKIQPMIDSFRLNTAISEAMKFMAEAEKTGLDKQTAEKFLVTLAPIFPFIAEELWQKLGHTSSVFKAHWPEASQKAQVGEINILINQKFITILQTEEIDEQTVVALAQDLPVVKDKLADKATQAIYKPGMMINFVTKP